MKDIQERIALLEQRHQQQAEEIAALKKQLEAPEKKEKWRAEDGEVYFYIDGTSRADMSNELDDSTDKKRYESFNYFQISEEAERVARVQLAFRKLDWAIRQFEVEENRHNSGWVFELNSGDTIGIDQYMVVTYCLPKLKNKQDAEYILSNYQPELLTFLTGGER